MRLAVIGNKTQLEELLHNCTNDTAGVVLYATLQEALLHSNEAIIDLDFDYSEERIHLLRQALPATILVHGITALPVAVQHDFVRINGWHGFLKNSVTEAAAAGDDLKKAAENTLAYLGKTIKWTGAGAIGFIAARVVAMIINEAYLAYGEGVSTKDEIDTAMKLGTNYPFGPFEWSEKIGLKNVYALLNALHSSDEAVPAAALINEVKQ